jgi:hypothetical protein
MVIMVMGGLLKNKGCNNSNVKHSMGRIYEAYLMEEVGVISDRVYGC